MPPGGQFGPMGGQGARTPRNSAPAIVTRNLWYIDNEGKLEVMRVQTGISNGTFTEILSMEGLEGRQVVLREKI